MFNIDYFVPEFPNRLIESYGNYTHADYPVTLYLYLPNDCYLNSADTSGRPMTRMLLDFQHNEVAMGSNRLAEPDCLPVATSASGNPAPLRSTTGEQFGTVDLQWLSDRNRLYLEQVLVPVDDPEYGGPHFELPYIHRATLTQLRTTTLVSMDFVFGFATEHGNTPLSVAMANAACLNFGTSTLTVPAYGNKLTTLMGDGGDTYDGTMRIGLRGVTIENPEEDPSTVVLDKNIIVLEAISDTWSLVVNGEAVATDTGLTEPEREFSLEWCETENSPSTDNSPAFNELAEVKVYYRIRQRAFGGSWAVVVEDSAVVDVDFRGSCKIIATTDLEGATSGIAYSMLELTQANPATPCIHMEEFYNFGGAWRNLVRTTAEESMLIDTSVYSEGGGG